MATIATTITTSVTEMITMAIWLPPDGAVFVAAMVVAVGVEVDTVVDGPNELVILSFELLSATKTRVAVCCKGVADGLATFTGKVGLAACDGDCDTTTLGTGDGI
jgi:hypothetical protein